MDMPCISTHAYNKQVKVILEVLEDEADKRWKSAGQRIRQLIVKENDEVCSSGILDETGQVLDYHISSKSCQKCLHKKSECQDDVDAFYTMKKTLLLYYTTV
jgi:hypothetical protein